MTASAQTRPIGLLIAAMGGEGGGVLRQWLVDAAVAHGLAVQSTSIPGVAQRTGATTYYIEMQPMEGDADPSQRPVMSLYPVAGSVDIMVASELIEAGRAMQNGFVTPDCTTLIASSHRALAVSEKTVPGDGMANAQEVIAAAEIAAQRFIHFDMEQLAADNGTVISASLLGALAGSATLPFTRQQFEEAISRSGRGVDASLRAFSGAFDLARDGRSAEQAENRTDEAETAIHVPEAMKDGWQRLVANLDKLPAGVRELAEPGLTAVVDFQDLDYGKQYLSQLDRFLAKDTPDKEHELSRQTAKYLARAMAYDDIFRVADLKTRVSRFERIREDMKQPDGSCMAITDFVHPQAEELVSMLPARLGCRIQRSPSWMKWIDRLFNRGRRLRTDRLLSFLQLYTIAGLKRWRRGTFRHAVEQEHVQNWLNSALELVETDYDFAVELICNQRLIKGYSKTHTRGLSKFARVNEGAMLVLGRPDAADWVRRLREAALQDEKGEALDGALKTVQSFSKTEIS